ncbi:MAG: Mrp/NBP35 family ATP-binding protein [Desulfobacterales bacterium]
MVEILERMPPSPEAVRNEQERAIARSLERIRHKLLVMSGKGGVGKTSTAVNLALTLSARGKRVGLMDVDLHGPDVPRMLGLSGTPELNPQRKLNPLRVSETLSAISMESFLPSRDDAVIWRGPLKFSAIRQFIGDVEWGDLDFLIIDAPPGTGDEPLTVAQQVPNARAVIVTTPQEVALADVRKSINFCRTVKMEILGLIENMSGFACPHCGKPVDLFGTGGGERTCREMGIAFLGRIPLDPRMVDCADRGCSFIQSYPDSPVSRALDAVAERILAATDSGNRSPLPPAG